MNRGRARQSTFIDDTDYRAFLETLAEAHRQWGIEVFAYCLMGNHYHLCLRTPRGNLSRIMRHVDGIYTQRFNRRHRRDGTLFRGRYKGILIDADEYLAAVVRYIELNAVAAGLVKMPEDYRWGEPSVLSQGKRRTGLARYQRGHRTDGEQAFHKYVLTGNSHRSRHIMKPSVKARYSGVKPFSWGSDNEESQPVRSIHSIICASRGAAGAIFHEIMGQHKVTRGRNLSRSEGSRERGAQSSAVSD